MSFSSRNDEKIGWILAAAIALAGYATVVAPAETEIRARASQAHEYYRLAARNEAALGQSSLLRRERREVSHDLAKLGGASSAGSAALATLHLLEDQSRELHVSVANFSPDQASAENGSQAMSIGLRGSYPSVVSFVAGLSRRDVLLEVLAIDLAAERGGGEIAPVDATIHARVYYNVSSIAPPSSGD